MQKNRLALEEVNRIEEMIEEGKTIKEISEITGRSTQTITRVKSRMGTAPVSSKEHTEVAKMLKESWPPTVTEKCKYCVPKKKQSNFRTPYNTRRSWY